MSHDDYNDAPAEEEDIGYRAIVQLAGCLTAAEGHVDDDVRPGVYGYSLAYETVSLLRRAFDQLAGGRSPQQVINTPTRARRWRVSHDKQGEAQCPDCGGSIADHQYHGLDGHDWKCLEPHPSQSRGASKVKRQYKMCHCRPRFPGCCQVSQQPGAGMTPHFEALGRRAVACKGWRWMPGMLHRYRNNSTRVTEENVWHSRSGWPDFSDPATKGCVLARAREAWKRPTAYLYYYGGNWFFDPQQSEPTDHPSGRTEAEALVAALRAAP